MRSIANSSRGQLKVQEMAFALVAILIFFGIIALFFFKIYFSDIQTSVEDQRAEEASQLVRKLASTPEFSFSQGGQQVCEGCIDFDKAVTLKNRPEYRDFWNIDYLMIEKIYPSSQGECSNANYPNCRTLTLVNNSNYTGIASSTYISLCRIEFKGLNYYKCELGRIYASGKLISK